MSEVYVVDTTIVVQALITDAFTANVDVLFAHYKDDAALWVPEFCRLECVNVLWKQVRFRGMPQAQAERAIEVLFALPLKIAPVESLYTRALQIGLANQLAVYDSVYIALAERLACPLITVDAPQIRAATAEAVTIKPITDFAP